ncbi:MAG: rhomboid family intramembrane serine protease [Planctomycetota bacterium]|nr:rhomboid family intramembrane serine protease [Planctomycetota bacterium]
MALSERGYARDNKPWRAPGAPWSALPVNTLLIIVNVVIFVVQAFLPKFAVLGLGQFDVLGWWGHFSTVTLFKLEVWRLVSFQFLHAGVLHLFMNMMGLYFFGAMVEQYLGKKKYLAFYLVCGICGGLAYLLLNLAGIIAAKMGLTGIPGLLYGSAATPLVGASAGVFGVILACAFIAPNAVVQLLIPPIPLKMKFFAYGYVAIAFISVFLGAKNAGGEAAHLGGAIAGFFFIRNSHLLRDFFDIFDDSRKKPDAPAAGPPPGQTDAEVDRILDKVRDKGLHALSDKERATLERASQRKRNGA